MLQIPGTFGEYSLVRLLGKGGMASVYLAKKPSLNGVEQECAIKVIHPHLSNDQEFVQMLIDEAQLSSQLKHQNIVDVYHLGNENGLYYITMEFIDGCDVYQALIEYEKKQAAFPSEVAAWIAHEACAGLAYAHHSTAPNGTPLNIIHRDISPQNIQLAKNGEVKIVDFGIAKADQRQNHTMQGIIKGKYSYMSPEQAWGDQMDYRSDIFSLGICLYEMIAGEVLYDAENGLGLLEQVRLAQIPNLRAIRPDLPVSLEQIVYRALHPEPQGRYQSAEEMRQALAHYLHEARVSSGQQLMISFMQNLGVVNNHPQNEVIGLEADDKTQAVSANMFAGLSAPAPAMAPMSSPPFSSSPASPAPLSHVPLGQSASVNSVSVAQSDFTQEEKTRALNIDQFSGLQGEEKTRAVSANLFESLKTPIAQVPQSAPISTGEQEKTKAVSASLFKGLGPGLAPPPPPPVSMTAATSSLDQRPNASLDQFQSEEKTRALNVADFGSLHLKNNSTSVSPEPKPTVVPPMAPRFPSPQPNAGFPSPQPNTSFPSPQPNASFPSPQPASMDQQQVSAFPSPYATNPVTENVEPSKALSNSVSLASPLQDLEPVDQPKSHEQGGIESSSESREANKRERSKTRDKSKKTKSSKGAKPSSKARSNSSSKLTLIIGIILLIVVLAVVVAPKLLKPAAPAQYALSVSANAQGAKVYRDGQDTGQFTPALLQGLKPNIQYLIKVKAQGYEVIEKPVMFSSEALLNQTEQSLRLFLTRAKGSLRINSTPSGASVYMDNNYLGKTPIFKRNVERAEGGVELKFRREGCDAKTVILTWGDDLKSVIDTPLNCR